MGNSPSARGHHEDTVDYGSLTPQGVYTGVRDWNHAIVSQLICARKLAPFYRPLEDYNPSWDDDQILAARKELPVADSGEHSARAESQGSSTNTPKSFHGKKLSGLKEQSKSEAAIYRGAVECPICFLYYPPNINHSRCCDQAICTECFVQIKRNEPTTTHLVSEPACCPYCVQENFGVVYTPPPLRGGTGNETISALWSDSQRASQHPSGDTTPSHKRRQKSYSADSPEVVTADQIRPDWEAKLAAVRAAVARRANRRIIMRQVGDRLIPIGITSGRVHALNSDDPGVTAENADSNGSRRSRRRPNQTIEQWMGIPGQDLEELMLMEAMRLSLLEHEEQQRKEAEERKKQAAQGGVEDGSTEGGATTGPGSLTLESHTANSSSSRLAASSSAPVVPNLTGVGSSGSTSAIPPVVSRNNIPVPQRSEPLTTTSTANGQPRAHDDSPSQAVANTIHSSTEEAEPVGDETTQPEQQQPSAAQQSASEPVSPPIELGLVRPTEHSTTNLSSKPLPLIEQVDEASPKYEHTAAMPTKEQPEPFQNIGVSSGPSTPVTHGSNNRDNNTNNHTTDEGFSDVASP